MFWRLKSRPGRPPIPARLQALIRQMARENPLWGEERIANELQVKLGIEVSPRRGAKIPSTRLLHLNVTAHPSAAWTLQQLREVVGLESQHRFLLHDRDSIFSTELDRSIAALGITVLKSGPRTPQMNAVCERVIGTVRRECLDWLIPLSDAHLRTTLRSWVKHYNRGRSHMGLGPGIPDPPITQIARPTSRHRRGDSYIVRVAARDRVYRCNPINRFPLLPGIPYFPLNLSPGS